MWYVTEPAEPLTPYQAEMNAVYEARSSSTS